MKTYREYLAESATEYNYRIKTVKPLESEDLDRFERFLQKYDVLEVSDVRKTPIQECPLEFVDVKNAEVYIMDIVTRLPVSSYVLKQELRELFGVPENYVVVRGSTDPLELETERKNAESDKEVKARLSTNSEYDEDEQIKEYPAFGDEFNKRVLASMAHDRKNRKDMNYKGESNLTTYNQEIKKPDLTNDINSDYIDPVATEMKNDNVGSWGEFINKIMNK